MKKKILGFLAMAVCACVVIAGCSKEEEKDTAKKEQKETTTKVEKQYETIGNKTDDAYEILVTNSVGQDIKEIAVKSSDKEEWPANMLPTDKTFKKDATVRLYYTPEADDNQIQVETDKAVKPSYDVKLVFADGTICQLSGFAFADMDETAIKYEDKIAFLEYTSKESKEKVSTKEQELALKTQKEQEEAAKKAIEDKAAADAAAQAATQAAEEAPQTEQYEEPYSEPDYSQTYEEPYVEPQQPAEQGSEGCLGGAEQSSEGCLQ